MADSQPTTDTRKAKHAKAVYESLKALGLCVRCEATAVLGRAQCRTCLDGQAAKRTAIKAGAQAGGCSACGKNRDRPGRRLCRACNDLRTRERERRTSAGLCPCGRPITTAGRKKCDPCNALEAGRKTARKASGLCQCGKTRDDARKKLCAACREYHRLHAGRRNAARMAAGICTTCGGASRPSRRMCAGCGRRQSDACRRWAAANPDKRAAIWAAGRFRRQQRVAFASGRFTGQEWRDLKARYGHTCLACGRKEPEIRLTVDHVVSLARGGSNDIGNIQPLCLFCNLSKHAACTDYRPAAGVAS